MPEACPGCHSASGHAVENDLWAVEQVNVKAVVRSHFPCLVPWAAAATWTWPADLVSANSRRGFPQRDEEVKFRQSEAMTRQPTTG